MIFNRKPQKPIKFTANSSKNTQGYCQATKESLGYNPSLHTHVEDHFHHPQILSLVSGTHTQKRDKKHNEIYQKVAKTLLQKQNTISQLNSRFTTA